jgi:hypothetical protein
MTDHVERALRGTLTVSLVGGLFCVFGAFVSAMGPKGILVVFCGVAGLLSIGWVVGWLMDKI